MRKPCPACGADAAQVSAQTIRHQLKQPWQWQESKQDYYFCASKGCDIVYFAADTRITQAALRQTVGVKTDADDALLCYCFDVARRDAALAHVRAYVVAQTQAGQCACKVRNPSGRCCLKDFPK